MALSRFEFCLSFQINISCCEESFVNVCVHRADRNIPSRTNLAGFLKIKLRASGLRVVYQLRRTETEMLVIVIGVRADDEVYEIAQKRSNQYNLLG